MPACPTPSKLKFETRKLALQYSGRSFNAGHVPLKMRPYKCRCREWHLTKSGVVDAEIRRLLHAQDVVVALT